MVRASARAATLPLFRLLWPRRKETCSRNDVLKISILQFGDWQVNSRLSKQDYFKSMNTVNGFALLFKIQARSQRDRELP